jgi:SAM-dependent methyltransferase
MEQGSAPLILNLGCGPGKIIGAVNVDINPEWKPDVLMDLTTYPWPWREVDGIVSSHMIEHIPDWWRLFEECVRTTRRGGFIHITVPDYTDLDSMTVGSHLHTFSLQTFKGRVYGIENPALQGREPDYSKFLPVKLSAYYRVIHKDYIKWWMPKLLVRWMMKHTIGFVLEQKFEFIKI